MLLTDVQSSVTGATPLSLAGENGEAYDNIIEILNRRPKFVFSVEWECEVQPKRSANRDLNSIIGGRYKTKSNGIKAIQFDSDPSTHSRHRGSMWELKIGYLDKISFPKVHEKFTEAEQYFKWYENDTCGVHVHIDAKNFPMLKRIEYSFFFGKKLQALMRSDSNVRKEYRERCENGSSRWCSPTYEDTPHTDGRSGSSRIGLDYREFQHETRYKMINYLAVKKFGTIENRFSQSIGSWDAMLKRVLFILQTADEYIKLFETGEPKNIFTFDGSFTNRDSDSFVHEELGEINKGGETNINDLDVTGEQFLLNALASNRMTFSIMADNYKNEQSVVSDTRIISR
jgi:hypothetical protein